jgi:hypothetical protein
MTNTTNTTNNPQNRMNTTAAALAKIALAAAFLAAGIAYAKTISHHDTAARATYSHR